MEVATVRPDIGGVLKHAVLGSMVGIGVAIGSTYVSSQLNSLHATQKGLSPLEHGVITGVVQGSVAALGIMLGDRFITSVSGSDDPLFRLFYYQVAFAHGGFGIANATRMLFNSLTRPSSAAHKCSDCTKTGKSCGGCSH